MFLPLSHLFLSNPCPFLSHIHSHFSHTRYMGGRSVSMSCVHWHDLPIGIKSGNHLLSDYQRCAKFHVGFPSIKDVPSVWFERDVYEDVCDQDSKSAQFSSAPLKRGRRERMANREAGRRGAASNDPGGDSMWSRIADLALNSPGLRLAVRARDREEKRREKVSSAWMRIAEPRSRKPTAP